MERDELWDRLKTSYQKHGLVLALGAGVAKGCNLPNWEGLLRKLAEKHPEHPEGSLFDNLKADGYSLPAIAGILEIIYQRELFSRAIWENLYEGFEFRTGLNNENRQRFIQSVQNDNKTLAAVAGLSVCRDTDNRYLPNPRIHAIVNFNFDSIFRAYVNVRYNNARLLRSIERPSAGSSYASIPVYYMHGFFRFDKDIEDYKHGAADLRIFTEQEYFDFFNNPNGLFNYTFLYLLREYPCLFIGLSMKDDNIRRLLHYSKSERVEGYIQERRGQIAEIRSIRHYAILPIPKDEVLRELTESSLRRLGTAVLWINDFEDIPERLGEVYDSLDLTDLNTPKRVGDIQLSHTSKWSDVF